MRLRYIAEQRDKLKSVSTAAKLRKKDRFNLSSDSEGDNDVVVGFTHKGRPMTLEDDFQEKISDDSDVDL